MTSSHSPCHLSLSHEWRSAFLNSNTLTAETKEEVGSTTTTGLGTCASVSCGSMWSRGTSTIQSPMGSPVVHSYVNTLNDGIHKSTAASQRLEHGHIRNNNNNNNSQDFFESKAEQQIWPASNIHSSLSIMKLDDPIADIRHPFLTVNHPSTSSQYNETVASSQHRLIKARSPPLSLCSVPSDDGNAIIIDVENFITSHSRTRARLSGFPTFYQSGQRQSNNDCSRIHRSHSACFMIHHSRQRERSCLDQSARPPYPSPRPTSKQSHNHRHSASVSPHSCVWNSTVSIHPSSGWDSWVSTTQPSCNQDEQNDCIESKSRHVKHKQRSTSWDSSGSNFPTDRIYRSSSTEKSKRKGKNRFWRLEQLRDFSEENSDVGRHFRHLETHKPLNISISESTDDEGSTEKQESKHYLRKSPRKSREIVKTSNSLGQSSYAGILGYLRWQRDRISAWLWTVFAVGTPAFYILVAFLDVQGGTLTVVAFNYANLASCCLIDWISLLIAFLLSVKFMGEKATKSHIIALLLGLAGSLCILVSDSIAETTQKNSTIESSFVSPLQARPQTVIDVFPASQLRQISHSELVVPAVSLDDQRTILSNGIIIPEIQSVSLMEIMDPPNRTLLSQSNKELNSILQHQQQRDPRRIFGITVEWKKQSRLLSEITGFSIETHNLLPSNDRKELSLQSESQHKRVISREERLFGDTMCLVAAAFLGIVTVMMEKALVVGVPSSELLRKRDFFFYTSHS